jgi:hypothetical protein
MERAVPELGAGIRVTTRAGQVDASALALARRAAQEVASRAVAETAATEAPDAGG